uniref:Exo84_C domain-containing protein n=1 Tax=Panagrellus redivivus TaxID=6233 RepID=A0A7E4USQ0_PANRE
MMSSEVNNDEEDRLFEQDNFNAADYVNNFLKDVRSGEEVRKLQQLRGSLSVKNASSSEAIKDIVFERYRQFIDTSKEVSHLEREIYQLSSLLGDQKTLIENMMGRVGHAKREVVGGGPSSAVAAANQPHNPLQVLMQKMDGVASVLNNLQESDKILLQNEMTLLDGDSMEPLHPILLVLVANSVVIGYPSDSTKYRFQLQSVHNLDSLAVVNVKQKRGTTSTGDQILQLLIFPDQLYVKCESARVKREWFEGIEQAKRKQQQENSLVRQATIRAKRRSIAGKSAAVGKYAGGSEAISEEQPETDVESAEKANEDLQWAHGLINEVHDAISRREMETAVDYINEWKQSKCNDANLNTKWTAIEKQVVKMLSDEIRSPGALHGGAQVIRTNMNLLASLDRATYAMDLFLKRRTKALRTAASELPVSEEHLSYVKQVSTLFVDGILDVAKTSLEQSQNLCQMLQFASSELKLLLSLIRRNVIEVAHTMAVLAHTWRILMDQCSRLADAGLDLSFEVHRLLAPSLQTAIESNFSNVFEAIKLRISEERWRPYNLESELSLNRFLEEMSDIGLNVDWAVSVAPKYCLNLASSACYFSRVSFALSRDLGLLHSSHLHRLCDGFVVKLWRELLTFLVASGEKLKAAGNPQQAVTVHDLTCTFIVSQVLPLCEETYEEGSGILADLVQAEFPGLAHYATNDDDDANSYEEEVANV